MNQESDIWQMRLLLKMQSGEFFSRNTQPRLLAYLIDAFKSIIGDHSWLP